MFNLQIAKRRLSLPTSTIESQGSSIRFRHPLGSLGAPLDCSIGGIGIQHDYEVEEEGQEAEVARGSGDTDKHSVIEDMF